VIWKAGLKVLKSHPVADVGAAAYPEAVRPRLGTPGVPGHQSVAHNTFLSVLSSALARIDPLWCAQHKGSFLASAEVLAESA
jgi:hypothetical protein